MSQRKDVSLVLGSGGARGHAHIGVIRALEERDFRIRNIAGTSIGAVIGGVYAAKELHTYGEWASRLEKADVVKLLDLSFSRTSIFKGERIISVLRDLIGDRKIEDLDRGFTAIATSLHDEREIWLNKGSLFDAMRASTAVPGLFSPVTVDNRTLVDGGLVNPIPIAPTLNDATDMTIAVSLSGTRQSRAPQAPRKKESNQDDNGYRAKIARFVDNLLDSNTEENSTTGAGEALAKSLDIMQGAIARLKLAAYTPDAVISVSRDACSFFEFHRADEMAELGYEATNRELDRLDL